MPAHRESVVQRFSGRFRGRRLAVAFEATTGWRFVVEELDAIGARAHLAEPAGTSARRGTAPPPPPWIKFSEKARVKLRTAMKRGKVKVVLSVRAADAAGNRPPRPAGPRSTASWTVRPPV
jgi:hypothetical protein